METLLIFFAIIAIQMIAAYSAKQKKEAAKKAPQKTLPSWQQTTEPAQSPFKETRRIIMEPSSTENPEFLEAKKKEPLIEEEKNNSQSPLNSQFSILNSQLNLKDPAQGILWTAILHEPRYKVRWKRK